MITVRAAGDAAVLLDLSARAAGDRLTAAGVTAAGATAAGRVADAIRAAGLPGLIDVVPGAQTVLVSFEPGRAEVAGLTARLIELGTLAAEASPAEVASPGPVCWIDVVYDGPDLAEVAALTGLSVAAVIERHQEADYRVGWLGFAPGFGYLTGLDPVLAAVPRLDSPRLVVPAGSVAIAGGLAAVYPAPSPGGWRLLGQTSAALWDVRRDPPALLVPGSRVRFRAVRSGARVSDGRAGEPERPRFSSLADSQQVEVVQPGPLTTIQDLGRPGLAHLGVPASGAVDRRSLLLANELAGNEEDAACLEITLGRLTVRFGCAAVIALTGAPVPVRLTPPGELADGQAARAGSAFAVAAGTVLRLGPPPSGLRSYLAVRGGFDVPPVLGSRSADLLSGLGPPPLRPGDVLRIGTARSGPKGKMRLPQPDQPRQPAELRLLPGPRDDWFAAAALPALAAGTYAVSGASDRTGLRLTGPALTRSRLAELPSEGVATGSLQVSHDGQPILLLADHPTTGGYPVIAVVVSADVSRAAQLRPGQPVRFRLS